MLTVGGIDGLSRDYNDESLESVISEERAKKRAPESEDAYRAYLWIGGGVIVRNRNKVPGCLGCLRISIGTPKENDILLKLMQEL